jgi:hypothetical protein
VVRVRFLVVTNRPHATIDFRLFIRTRLNADPRGQSGSSCRVKPWVTYFRVAAIEHTLLVAIVRLSLNRSGDWQSRPSRSS